MLYHGRGDSQGVLGGERRAAVRVVEVGLP
jgi:hypothetical protein